MTERLLPLRRGVKLEPGDPAPRCPALYIHGERVDRCSHRAAPLHDLHSASGESLELNDDDELEPTVYGVAWITRAALTAGRPREAVVPATHTAPGRPPRGDPTVTAIVLSATGTGPVTVTRDGAVLNITSMNPGFTIRVGLADARDLRDQLTDALNPGEDPNQ